MTIEYVVLGVVLIAMGIVQTWLRHGPEGRKLRATELALSRRLEDQASEDQAMAAGRINKRTRGLWSTWTAILGPVGMAFGIFLVVMGALGR